MASKQPVLIDDGPILSEMGLAHNVLEPAGPGPYRTVVMLHGRYGNEEAMWIFRRSTPANWLKIAPRGIVAEGGAGFSWLHQEYGVWPELPAFDDAVSAVVRFIEALPRVYNSDPEQITLMGFSQGAAVSYATAMRHPGLVQAIAGLVGFMPEGCANPQSLAGLEAMPMFMAVGLRDERIPYEQSLGCARNLLMANAELSYEEYNTGHRLNRQGMQDLHDWMHKR